MRGIHSEDEPYLSHDQVVHWDSASIARRHAQELADVRNPIRRKLHSGLFPQPFVGNIAQASVFVLFGNPGLSVDDYVDELENEGYVAYCRQNLLGEVGGFGPLMLAAAGTAAAAYWEPVFGRLIRELAEDLDLEYVDARGWLVSQVATIEAGAYHSMNFPAEGFARLPSTQVAISYVQDELHSRALRGECLVFVWRQAKLWGLPPSDNVVVRDPKQAQARFLQHGERQYIARFLALRYRREDVTSRI